MKLAWLVLVTVACALVVSTPARADFSTTITYQGRLTQNGKPANGTFNMTFTLYAAASGGPPINEHVPPPVTVTDGNFTVKLDFGLASFDNSDRWLEIAVSGSVLTPRQQITRAPYSIQTRGINVNGAGNVGIGTTAPTEKVHIITSTTPNAITAVNTSTSSFRTGVYGETNALTDGSGVYGRAVNVNGVLTRGVRGVNLSPSGYGVHGESTHSSGNGVGVRGDTNSVGGAGVHGHAPSIATFAYGVLGSVASSDGVAVFASSTHTTGDTVAVLGQVASPNGYAGYFLGGQSYFEGNVGIGTTDPEAPLHVLETSAGAVTANSNSIMVLERSAGGFLSILGADGNSKGILFGNVSDNDSGGILYDQVSVASEAMQFRTGGNLTRMIILNNGSVGIGTNSPTQLLSVDGSAGKPGGGSWSTFSDARLKKNIQPLTGALHQLMSLHPVSFEYINPRSIHELPGPQIGMIAQEVEQVFPHWVEENQNGFKTVTYRGFEALTVQALRELREEKDAQVESLRDELQQRDARIASLEHEMQQLKAMVRRLAAQQGD